MLAAVLGFVWLAMPCHADDAVLRLATTTTTENSGLMAHLLPAFEKAHGYRVRLLAAGSGRALKLLANGDVDVALTHAPKQELAAVERGEAADRHPLMYNDFVLVGPIGGLQGAETTLAAKLRRIANTASLFLSRGDESGTHKRETALWTAAGITPLPDWYRETGQGMGRTLLMASELGAFTLTDRGTWLAYRHRLNLELDHQGGNDLLNLYSVLPGNTDRHPDINAGAVRAFLGWVFSDAAKARIQAFTIDGQPLFVPLL